MEDAGSGRPQHDPSAPDDADVAPGTPALGTWARRIDPGVVYADNAAGQLGILSEQHWNLCEEPTMRSRLTAFSRFGVPGRYVDVFVDNESTGSPDGMILVCSVSKTPTWPSTTGPGGEGVSVPCPEWAPVVDRRTGAVFHRSLDKPHLSYRDGATTAPTQSSGGYGKNGDGLWNYRFHNWGGSDVVSTVWVGCRRA